MERHELDPAEALALARDARERMAARADVPNWYGWCYGIFCGLIVAGGGLGDAQGMALLTVGICGLVVIYRSWVERTGIEVNGYRAGRTRLIATLLGIAMTALMIGAMIMRRGAGLEWAPYAAGGIGPIVAIVAGYAWERAWKAELRRER